MLTPDTCSPDTLLLWSCLPQLVQMQEAALGYPWLSWMEGLGGQLQVIDDLVRDQQVGDVSYPGWSAVLDVTRCPTDDLPWLAQFVGVRFSSLQIGNDAAMRAAIVAEQGFQRGTLASVQSAADAWLSPGFHVTIIERMPDPYTVTINIPSAGVTGQTFAQIAAAYASFTALAGAFANFAAITAQVTNLESAVQAALPGGLRTVFNVI